MAAHYNANVYMPANVAKLIAGTASLVKGGSLAMLNDVWTDASQQLPVIVVSSAVATASTIIRWPGGFSALYLSGATAIAINPNGDGTITIPAQADATTIVTDIFSLINADAIS